MTDEIVCRLEKITKAYPPTSAGGEIEVLRGVDLTIHPGESVAVVGPSGSGKSTLLNIIGCLDEPTSGRLFLGGEEVDHLDQRARADIRNRFLGFVFQLHHLLPQCTVLENVLVPTLTTGKVDPKATDRGYEMLKRVDLIDRADHRPAELSGGECLRAAIARALVNHPKLLLADEPTGSLDAGTSAMIGDLLFDLNRTDGTTLVLVTHSADLASRSKFTYTLENGVLAE